MQAAITEETIAVVFFFLFFFFYSPVSLKFCIVRLFNRFFTHLITDILLKGYNNSAVVYGNFSRNITVPFGYGSNNIFIVGICYYNGVALNYVRT